MSAPWSPFALRSLHDAAVAYAERGWHVFPLAARGKRPATRHGLHDALTDVAIVSTLWQVTPHANIGVNCGASRLLVVDLDGEAGRDTWADLAARNGGHAATLTADTGGGGLHVYFAGTGPSTTRRLGAGVDTRGSGGYIVAPPSVHPSGGRYLFRDAAAAVAPAPAWLLEALTPPPAPPAPVGELGRLPAGQVFTRYGEAALEARVAEVAHAPHGQRNDTLVRAAFRAGRLALAGELEVAFAAAALLEAARVAGLDEREARRTIASGIAGAEKAGPAARRPRYRARR